jgi:hypothetical protein
MSSDPRLLKGAQYTIQTQMERIAELEADLERLRSLKVSGAKMARLALALADKLEVAAPDECGQLRESSHEYLRQCKELKKEGEG